MIKHILLFLLIPTLTFAQLIISGNAELVASGDVNIILSGDWSNNATNTGFTASTGNGIVYFHSTSAQSIGGSHATTFGKIWLNNTNSASLTVNSTIYIVDKLDFEYKGIMHVGSGSITFKDNVTVDNPTQNKFIDGAATYDGTKAFTFPIGDGTKWAPVRIYTPGSSVSVTAKYFYSAGATNYPPNSTNVSAPLVKVSDVEYWHITSTTSPNIRVRLFWKDGTESGIGSIDPNILILAKYNGASWVDEPAAITASNTGSGYISSDAALNLNDLYVTFGTTNKKTNPLPITLVNFTAKEKNNKAILEWVTSSEVNNDYFVIEKSLNTNVWDEVTTINGAGNSSELNNYNVIDDLPYSLKSYYRLKQVDFDGNYSYSKIRMLNISNNTEINIYPNPTNGLITIELNRKYEHEVSIFDIYGNNINSLVNFQYISDTKILVDISRLSNGIYSILIGGILKKIIKQ